MEIGESVYTNDYININAIKDTLQENYRTGERDASPLKLWNDLGNLLRQHHVTCPTKKIYWNIFFRILGSRCGWLQQYSNYIPISFSYFFLFCGLFFFSTFSSPFFPAQVLFITYSLKLK
jgi:hypothetical protein